jgi:hypothetical protein
MAGGETEPRPCILRQYGGFAGKVTPGPPSVDRREPDNDISWHQNALGGIQTKTLLTPGSPTSSGERPSCPKLLPAESMDDQSLDIEKSKAPSSVTEVAYDLQALDLIQYGMDPSTCLRFVLSSLIMRNNLVDCQVKPR